MKLKLPELPFRRDSRKSRGTAVQIHMEARHYGLRITMPVSVGEDRLLELLARIPSKAWLLPVEKGIVLDFQSRACTQDLLIKLLCNVVWNKELRVLAWLSSSEESLRLFKGAGLSVTEPSEQPSAAPSQDEIKALLNSRAYRDHPGLKIVYNSLRSGQIVETLGDVVVWGHLNPGAEIIAGGNVIIAGRLRGLVHAGQGGRREEVFVLAGSFEATQMRLGRKLCYADESLPGWHKSVLITLEDGRPTIRENRFQV